MASLTSSVAQLDRLVDDHVDALRPSPVERRSRNRVLRRIAAMFVVQAVLTAWGVWALHRASEPWDPLGTYPEQVAPPVVEVTAGVPAVIEVKATKCARQAVLVTGTMAWVSVNPAGRVVPVPTAGAAGRRDEGCQELLFRNEVPDAVVSATLGYGGVGVWRITGVETPISADEVGVPAVWQTNEFMVIAAAAPI